MSKLLALIDEYKDAHGQPSDSSIARAIGAKPQTISSWRKRGLKQPPAIDTLRELARLLNVDFETVVLHAVLVDIEWVEDREERGGSASSMTG